MESIGNILRQEREGKGLTLEQAAKATHVRVNYLEALEKDDFHALPSPVQGKGFLRLYSDYLGIPVQPLLDIWNGKPAYAEPLVPQEPEHPLPASKDAPARTPTLPKISLRKVRSAPPVPPVVPVENTRPVSEVEMEAGPSVNEQAVPETSLGIFQEIGASLKTQRDLLGISFSDVEEHTHVRVNYLKILEDGDYSQIPSPVQCRGMLNNYAHFLNLDTDKILLRFAEGLQTQHHERLMAKTTTAPKARVKTATPPKAWRRLFTPDLVIGVSVIAALFILIIWGTTRITGYQNQAAQKTAPSISDILLVTHTATPQGSETPGAEANDQKRSPDEPTEQPASYLVPTGTLPAMNAGAIQVYIISRQRTYLRITVDKKVVFDGRTTPGNAMPYSGDQQIELLIGNAAAVQVFYNQNDLGTLGTTGEVKSLIFSKDGMITPTPLFTATPTKTVAPTQTLQPTPTVPTATVTPFIP